MKQLAALFLCSALACAKTAPVAAGLGEPCVGNNDCATGFVCAAGRCVLPANLGGCEPGRKRCNGADVEQCDASGLSWTTSATCATGCSGGACKPQVCTPGRNRCAGNASEQCTPDGAAWALVQVCPSACASDTGLCRAPVCAPFSARCNPANANGNAQVCDSSGASWQDVPCASGQVCDGGRCLQILCAPGQTRCSANGGAVETCNDKLDGWNAAQACGIRCGVTAGVAACLSPVCPAGASRCSPVAASAVEQCLPDRSAWAFVTFCASGCQSPATNQASCAAPVCAPFARRCGSSGGTVESCLADGTGWAQTDACPQGCAGGNCVTSSSGCSPGDLRCNGPDAQACAQTSPGVTQWRTQATCVAGCSSGACLPGGSCGAVTLHAAVPGAPGDGVSTVLFYSDPITGADGSLLPDGLAFSVAASAPSGAPQPLIVSADADAALPGVQVRSVGGRVHFTVRAPALSATDVTVTATAALVSGASCAASATLAFTAAAGPTVLVAEDFTSARARNLAVANAADWNVARGALVGTWSSDVGQGEDGPLSVATSTPYNLTTSGYAPAFAVVGLAGRTATLDGTSGLSGGDEVALWDVQGSSAGTSNAGAFESLHVASVSGTQVTFVEQPQGNYGIANDNDVAAQHVQLVRVPHFSALTVAAGSALTASSWDGTRGGLFFVRVSGAAKILGEVRMDGAGFRGGRYSGTSASFSGEDPTGMPGSGGSGAGYYSGGASYGTPGAGATAGSLYGLPLLGRLHLGAGGGGVQGGAGGAGGGAIVLFAGSLSLVADGSTAQAGRIHADGQAGQSGAGSGAGGSVWIGSPSVSPGSGSGAAVSAQGGASGGGGAGGGGRIRLDALSTDASGFGAGCSRTAPACSFGISGPLVAQSLDAFVLTDAQKGAGLAIRAATLSAALGAPARATYAASAATADVPEFGAASSVVPATTQFLSGAAPNQGTRFRYRVQLSPAPGAPSVLLGLQWSLQVN